MIYIYKILFYATLIIGTILTISSYRWIGIWFGLEINLLSIIPLINNNKNLITNESAIKYFIIQVIASTLFLFSVIIINYKININPLINLAIMLKIGAAPLHFWFPPVIEGLRWNNAILIITWQKIAPIIIIRSLITFKIIFIFIISSIIIGGIIGINQTRIRKIMSYSSINHIGWILPAILINTTTWTIYFIIYSFIVISISITINKFNVSYIWQLNEIISSIKSSKFLFSINFFSIIGLPPFLGFMPKWILLNVIIENNIIFLALIILIITMITIFFYIRIIMPILILSSSKTNTIKINNPKSIIISNFIISNRLILIVIINSII